MHVPFLTYLVICLVVGLFGKDKKFGFWGYFFASVALTPILGGILVVASDPRRLDS